LPYSTSSSHRDVLTTRALYREVELRTQRGLDILDQTLDQNPQYGNFVKHLWIRSTNLLTASDALLALLGKIECLRSFTAYGFWPSILQLHVLHSLHGTSVRRYVAQESRILDHSLANNAASFSGTLARFPRLETLELDLADSLHFRATRQESRCGGSDRLLPRSPPTGLEIGVTSAETVRHLSSVRLPSLQELSLQLDFYQGVLPGDGARYALRLSSCASPDPKLERSPQVGMLRRACSTANVIFASELTVTIGYRQEPRVSEGCRFLSSVKRNCISPTRTLTHLPILTDLPGTASPGFSAERDQDGAFRLGRAASSVRQRGTGTGPWPPCKLCAGASTPRDLSYRLARAGAWVSPAVIYFQSYTDLWNTANAACARDSLLMISSVPRKVGSFFFFLRDTRLSPFRLLSNDIYCI
jgi:hypothetical protein